MLGGDDPFPSRSGPPPLIMRRTNSQHRRPPTRRQPTETNVRDRGSRELQSGRRPRGPSTRNRLVRQSQTERQERTRSSPEKRQQHRNRQSEQRLQKARQPRLQRQSGLERLRDFAERRLSDVQGRLPDRTDLQRLREESLGQLRDDQRLRRREEAERKSVEPKELKPNPALDHALWEAARKGDAESALELLYAGANPYRLYPDGWLFGDYMDASEVAIKNGHPQVVKVITDVINQELYKYPKPPSIR